jgi:lipoprotein-anchoring transpeptidase ErfK/SrfK
MRINALFRAGLVAAGLLAAPSAFAYMTYPTAPTYPSSVRDFSRPAASAIPRETISYYGPEAPGTVIISTSERRLYLILPDHEAFKYGVGVGREGFTWSGTTRVAMKKEWPDWTPPAAMLKRRPDLPRHMKGGIDNPLGARALYLGASEFRIHGSNEPETIGQAVSSGCIRMTNDDVKDLYERVPVGAKVIVEE